MSAIQLQITSEGIATIILNRPEVHNAFNDELIVHLTQILKNCENDPHIRLIILTGAGKSFSAGADLNWMKKMATYTYEENIQDALCLAELMHTLKHFTKPTIAKVQGAAYGGGIGLIACCDIAIAASSANFALTEVKIGLVPAVISPYVISAIGERAARRYFLTAEKISALEAHRLGLISQVAEIEQLDTTTEEIAKLILSNAPQAVCHAKKLINHFVLPEPHQKNVELIARLRVSAEGQEGLSAFLEKRTPQWSKNN